ncbi:MAG TPA: putative 2OG-Fe(II) oxygenase [Steroidobacteraceae bacterium]|nr:putative 2OG-Fe(II) oxygenase [Steroidobacteraceae bacterium]
MPSPEVINMFSVPFTFSRHPEPERINAALKRYIYAQEKSGTAANPRPLTQRNAALFESHFNLFRESDAAVQELKVFCWNQLFSLVGRLNGYDAAAIKRLQIYNDSWFHVTRRGGFFGLHNHPNASWSGVYCVDPGRHDLDKTDSGLLCFVNPMIMSAMYMDAGNARMPLPYGYQVANVSLEAGQLVMFPSWVLHDVKAYEGEGERITIAFNCWFTLPDAA